MRLQNQYRAERGTINTLKTGGLHDLVEASQRLSIRIGGRLAFLRDMRPSLRDQPSPAHCKATDVSKTWELNRKCLRTNGLREKRFGKSVKKRSS